MRRSSLNKKAEQAANWWLAGDREACLHRVTTGRKVDCAALAGLVAVVLHSAAKHQPDQHEKAPYEFAEALAQRATFTDELDDTIARNREAQR